MRRFGSILAVVALVSACVSVEHTHHDTTDHHNTSPPPGSNLMLRGPITISDDLEVIISDVVIPAGATVPRHYHPGEEFVYVIEGSALHVEAGKPDQILSAGDAYVIPPEAEHAPRGGPDGARAIVFRVHKRGLPERVNIGDGGPVSDSSDLSLRTSREELEQLRTEIGAVAGMRCTPMAPPVTLCESADGREIYAFTEDGSPAHPAVLFRGFVTSEDGEPQLEERGWSAGDTDAAQDFFSYIKTWPKTNGTAK